MLDKAVSLTQTTTITICNHKEVVAPLGEYMVFPKWCNNLPEKWSLCRCDWGLIHLNLYSQNGQQVNITWLVITSATPPYAVVKT